MNYGEQVKRLAFDLMAVHKYGCKKCKNAFIQAISTSDTDMVPIFLSSVYATNPETLIIMELTTDEYCFGRNDNMLKRARKFFNNNTFFCIDHSKICPACGEKLEEKQIFKLSEYIKENPNVYIIYFSKNDDKKEIAEHF